jgi:general secretion pathway protein K
VAAVKRERGFALLIVLWTMALLAALVSGLTTSGRIEVQIASNLRAGAVAQAAADGALHEAILRLLRREWRPGGNPRLIRVGEVPVGVRVHNQDRKLNPNTAAVPVLRAFLVSLGVDAGKAESLARAIVEWRSPTRREAAPGSRLAPYREAGLPYGPPGQLYESADEIGLVLGMTPDLLARMKPYLSVYQEGDAPDVPPALADDAPRRGAPSDSDWQLGSTGRVMVVMIEATAVGPKGGRFRRQAVVRLRAEASLDQAPFQILTWDMPSE